MIGDSLYILIHSFTSKIGWTYRQSGNAATGVLGQIDIFTIKSHGQRLGSTQYNLKRLLTKEIHVEAGFEVLVAIEKLISKVKDAKEVEE